MRYPEFEKPWVLLCEGEADKQFFDKLIEARDIPRNFFIQFPDRQGGTVGRSKFGNWLALHRDTSENFNNNVKAILIVSDNDDNPATSFDEVKSELMKAGFPVPQAEQRVARESGFPAVVVLMIPIGRLGNLETLCLSAAETRWHLTNALDVFVLATPAHTWGISKQSKMRLQTTLAATCHQKPDTSFAQHWRQHCDYHIPLNHSCFDSIVTFLNNFGNLIS